MRNEKSKKVVLRATGIVLSLVLSLGAIGVDVTLAPDNNTVSDSAITITAEIGNTETPTSVAGITTTQPSINVQSTSSTIDVSRGAEVARRIPPNVTDSFTTPTNLTADEFNAVIDKLLAKRNILETSKLRGLGSTFVEYETQYGLNGLYAISICFESAFGTSKAARSKNNLVGAAGKSYASPHDCIMHLGDFLTRLYISKNLTTVSQISKKYCPPNASKWTNTVNSCFAEVQGYYYSL